MLRNFVVISVLVLAAFWAGRTFQGGPALSLSGPSYEQRAVHALEKMASKMESIDRSISKCR